MDPHPASNSPFRLVWHRTLRQASDQLRRVTAEVLPPVHVFDIRPQVMRGLYSVAAATRGGELHRCVVPYRDADMLAADRGLLEKVLLWGELQPVAGRIELGANTGELLRYFLPDPDAAGGPGAAAERCRRIWLDAALVVADGGEPTVRRLQSGEGGAIGCISRGRTHWLLPLGARGEGRLREACRRLGCERVGKLAGDSALFRDVMGEWQS